MKEMRGLEPGDTPAIISFVVVGLVVASIGIALEIEKSTGFMGLLAGLSVGAAYAVRKAYKKRGK